MKLKFLFTIIALVFASSFASYASFPVERVSSTNVTTQLNVVEKNKEELISPVAAAGEKSQIVAALLCWIVGTFGIHRFYLGYTWQGIVQILTFGGLGIWTLIDLVRILMGTLKPKDGEYDKTF